MPEHGVADDTFGRLVEELRLMADGELLAAWRANEQALVQRASDGHPLRLRHYAFRIVAVERFGFLDHVARRRALATP